MYLGEMQYCFVLLQEMDVMEIFLLCFVEFLCHIKKINNNDDNLLIPVGKLCFRLPHLAYGDGG